MAELRRYWDQLQEVKEAMTARAENAGSSDLPGSVEEADDSHAVLSHVQSQEQMVLDRVVEIGGQVALKEFKESIGDPNRSDIPAPAPAPRRTLARTPPPSPRPTAPLPEITTPAPPQDMISQEEEMCSHGEEVEEEVPGPSDEFYESMSKMEMAHEIVMNDKYQIERQQPQGLQGQVENTLKAAYWDIVREEVGRGEYGQCVEMLGQIRLNIEGIGTIEKLPPSHHFRQLISGELDTDLIKQQIEHNAFNLHQKIEAVVSILLKLCSAAQDEEIKAISKLTDVPTIFKSIFEAVDAIKLEIANFYLEQTKQKIRENSVEYEKAKFAEFLEVHPSGLDRTREWIRDSHSESGPLATMCNAYLKLLDVDPPKPETTALDQERYAQLGHNTRFSLLISLLSIRLSSLHEDLSEPSFLSSLLSTLRILAPENTNPADAADLIQAKTTDMVLNKVPRLPRDTVEGKVSGCLDSAIRGTAQDPVLDLLTRRLHGYLTERSLNRKAEVPKNLLGEVEGMGDQYQKLVHYNRQVYGSHYAAILKPPGQ